MVMNEVAFFESPHEGQRTRMICTTPEKVHRSTKLASANRPAQTCSYSRAPMRADQNLHVLVSRSASQLDPKTIPDRY